jgi:hypothetical protein
MPLKYWRTMICALALGLIGLVVWADDQIRGSAQKEQRAQTEPQQAAAPPSAQTVMPNPEPPSEPVPPMQGQPALNERNFDLPSASEPVQTKRGVDIALPVVTTPVAPPVVPPPPSIEIVVGKAESPLAQAPEIDIPIKPVGASEIVPAPASPALPEPPPPIPQAPKIDLKNDPPSVPPMVKPVSPVEPPPAPPPLPSGQSLLPPVPSVSPKLVEDKGAPLSPPPAPAIENSLPPAPVPALTQPTAQPMPTVPITKSATPVVTSAAPFQLHLHMGGAQTHRFEIRDGDKILLKVYCDKVELHGAQDGSSALPGLTATGHIRLHGAGLDGTCDQLTVAAADGKVTLKGSVHMTCYRGTNSSQVTAEQMSFQLNRAGETPVNTKARGTSSVVPASTNSFSNWTESKFP